MNKIDPFVCMGVKEFSIKRIYLEGIDILSRINEVRVLRFIAS